MDQKIRQKLERRYESKVVSGFEIKQIIGTGGFAKVRRATHKQTKQHAAVKIVNKATLSEEQLKKVYEQIETHKKLIHQNIVKVYQVCERNQKIYIFMEYCPRGQLFQYINKNGALDEETAIKFFKQILSAVEYIHSLNICHRDIKCENIMIDCNFNVKLIDFGFSKQIQKSQKLSTYCGSPSYCSPELILKTPYDGKKVDIWCLGILLYTMLSAQLPFDSHNIKKLKTNILSCIYKVHPNIPFSIQKVLKRIFTPASNRLTISDLKNQDAFSKYQRYEGNFIDIRHHQIQYDEQIVKKICQKYNLNEQQLKHSIITNKHNSLSSIYYLSLNYEAYHNKISRFDINSKDFIPKYKFKGQDKYSNKIGNAELRSSELAKPKRRFSNLQGSLLQKRRSSLTVRIRSSRTRVNKGIDLNELHDILRPKSPDSPLKPNQLSNVYRKRKLLKKQSKNQNASNILQY